MFHNKNLSSRKLIFAIILSLIVIASFVILKDIAFAGNGNNQTTVVYSEQSKNGDPYYGTTDYWNEVYGPHENLYINDTLTPGTTLTTGDYFISSDVTLECSASLNKPALTISGNVNLIFENNAKLTIKAADSKGNKGSYAGIRLTSGNTLNCSGWGNLDIYGGSVNVTGDDVKGGPTTNPSKGSQPITGDSGKGGNGSGGVGALIGSDGGNGGDGGPKVASWTPSLSQKYTFHGKVGNNGSNGEASSKVGTLLIHGNLGIKLTRGKLNKLSDPVKLDYSKHYRHCESIVPLIYIALGSNAPGAQGGYGFKGAFIGSGGSGGGGGGSGGQTGCESINLAWRDYWPNGGGAGAGAGSLFAQGGNANTGNSGEYKNNASVGESFDPATSNVAAQGGNGSNGADHAVASGGKGGNGGFINESPNGGLIYTNPGVLPDTENNNQCLESDNSGISFDKYEGKESTKYLCYPQNECKVVLDGSLSDKEYIFPWRGETIYPDYKLTYMPTGEEISTDCYNYVWINNTQPGHAQLKITGFDTFSSTRATIGKSITEPKGEIIIDFYIYNVFDVENYTIEKEKFYDGNQPKWTAGDVKIIDIDEKKLPDVSVNDLDFSYFEEQDDGTWKLLTYAPIDFGKYKVELHINKTSYKDWWCKTTQYFEISKAYLKINEEKSEGYTVSKSYDGLLDVYDSYLSGSVVFDNLAEIDKPYISVKPNLKPYLSAEAGEMTQTCTLQYEDKFEALSNYIIQSYNCEVNYVITQREIDVTSAIPKSRQYLESSYDIDFDKVTFSGLLRYTIFERGADWDARGLISDGNNDVGFHKCKCIVSLKNVSNGNWIFSDGTYTKTIENLDVEIFGDEVTRPSPSGTIFNYNGNVITYDVKAIDGLYTVEGNTAVEPGEYEAKYTLCKGKAWSNVPESERYKPYTIIWTINKHEAISLEEEHINIAAGDSGSKQYQLQFKDKPLDFDITDLQWNVTMGEEFLYSKSFDKNNYILDFQFNDSAKVGSKVSFDFTLKSNRYEDSTLNVSIDVIDKYEVEISGIAIEQSKTYDGTAMQVNSNNLSVIIKNDDVLVKDITSKTKQFVQYKFYQLIDGQYEFIGKEAVNAGKYYCIAEVDKQQTFAKGKSEEISFEILKRDALAFPKTSEEHCCGIKNLNYEGQLNGITETIPFGETYSISVGPIEDPHGIIDNRQITIGNDGKINIVLNSTALIPTYELEVSFVVEMQNYQNANIDYSLTIVDKTNLDIGGIQLENKEYDNDYLTYTGDFHIKLGDIDLTEKLLPYCKLIYRDHFTGVTYKGPQTKAGTYDIQIIIPEDNEYYRGESEIYTASITPRSLKAVKVPDIVKQFDGTTDVPSEIPDIEVENIIADDEVHAKLVTKPYESIDVGTKYFQLETEVYGEDASNYRTEEEFYWVKYQINPRVISKNNATAISREYELDNMNVNVNVNFNNIITAYPPSYTAVGTLDNNDVSDSAHVTSYKITLNDAQYTFKDSEGKETKEIIVTDDPLTTNITQAKLPQDFVENIDQCSYATEILDRSYQLDIRIIPLGQEYNISVKAITEGEDLVDGIVSVDHAGKVTYKLNKSAMVAGKSLKVTFECVLKNYVTADISYELRLVEKTKVTISGFDVEHEKIYDGEAADYIGGGLIIADEAGNDLTQQLRDQGAIKWKYFNRDTRETSYDAQWKVGSYDFIIFIDYNHPEYEGESSPAEITITPRPVTITQESIDIVKEYDGTNNIPDPFEGKVTCDNIIEGDDVYVYACAVPEKYSVSYVMEESKDVGIELRGEGQHAAQVKNYTLATGTTINATYKITPRILQVTSATAVSRDYSPTSYEVNVEVEFDRTISGYEPSYSAVGMLENNEVSENAKVYEYSVLLDPITTASSNITMYNYAFMEAGQVVERITIHDPLLYVEITKADGPQLSSTTESVSYGISNMNYSGQIDLSSFPTEYTYSLAIRDIEDSDQLIDNNQIVLFQDGKIQITLFKPNLRPNRNLIVNINVEFDNYETQVVTYTLNIVDKTNVQISGITYQQEKTYDRQYLSTSGSLYITDGVNDLTELLKPDLIVQFYDKNTGITYNEPQKNAGNYKITYLISAANELYQGSQIICNSVINQRMLMSQESIDVYKQYDATMELPSDFNDNVNIENVMSEDIDKVKARVLADKYSSSDAYQETKNCPLSLSGDASKNYVLQKDTIATNYKISPRIISVKESNAQQRQYDPENYNVDVNVIFENVISTKLPTYKAVGHLNDNNASDSAVVDYHVVTLNTNNYAFYDGEKEVREITITDPITVVISKAPGFKFKDSNEKCSPNIYDLNYYCQLDLSPIPQKQNYDIKIKNIVDEHSMIDGDNISVNNDGLVYVLLNRDSLEVGNSLIVNFEIQFQNYQTSTISFNLQVINKIQVSISGISYDSKTYDAEKLTYSGQLVIKNGEIDLTEQLKDSLVYRFANVATEDIKFEPQSDAGKYNIDVFISNDNEQYEGQVSFGEKEIFKRELTPQSSLEIQKVYDSTDNLPEGFDTKIDIQNVVYKDKDKVEANVLVDKFSQPNAYKENKNCDIELSGDASNNYKLKAETILTTFEISPRVIQVTQDKILGRMYEPDNFTLDMDVKFSNVVEGHNPNFDAVAYISDNEVASTVKVDKYIITLDPSQINNFTSEEGNYTFVDELDQPIKQIVNEHVTQTVEIVKNNTLPGVFNVEELQFVDDSGTKTYRFNLDNFPSGMIDENTRYFADQKTDDNNIIESWSVDNITGEITFTLGTSNQPQSKAQLPVRIISNNYTDSNSMLDITLNTTANNTALTYDSIGILFVISLLIIGLISGFVVVALRRAKR